MFPGFIGGHCVIPNLSLIDEESLWQIDKFNNSLTKNAINKKLTKKYFTKNLIVITFFHKLESLLYQKLFLHMEQ